MQIFETPLEPNEPITLPEAKEWLIVTHSQDDATITRLLKTARRLCERRTKKAFIPTTVSNVTGLVKPYEFPILPLIEVTTVEKYNYSTNAFDLLPADEYILLEGTNKLKIDNLQLPNKYFITFKAGYAAGELPEELKQAVLYQLGELYENRNLRGEQKGLHPVTEKLLLPFTPTSSII